MWTPATRRQHSRDGLRYETDLTDAEWSLIEPLMPAPRERGRPRAWPLREVLNAMERPRGHPRLRQSLPLRRLYHAPDPPTGTPLMNSGPDSKSLSMML